MKMVPGRWIHVACMQMTPWVFTAEVKSAKSAIAGRHQARFIENFLAHFMNGTITSLYASSPETQTSFCLVGGRFSLHVHQAWKRGFIGMPV